MHAIFYDLETTDSCFLGQILNYSFIHVGDDFEIVSECSGEIRVSRLQLPAPRAILTNRVNLVEHQETAQKGEPSALIEISNFIWEAIKQAKGKLPLIGYNSARFDLPFLRTSFIRNGINPYFGGKICYSDLLFAVRKLAAGDPNFPLPRSSDDPNKLSLRLESVTTELGLLSGVQTHSSRDDVILTIDLAKALLERFSLDVRSCQFYEATDFDKSARQGQVVYQLNPQYDLTSGSPFSRTPLTLLDCDHRSALWINLERYASGSGRSSVFWVSKTNGYLFIEPELEPSAEEVDNAQAALKEFARINLKNYFPPSTCDVEQDIYR
ncbi:MAG: hypothetical protein KDD42_06450, partial [Bdellovibrionales bacterium]|nr:hypothetical protein [Bdellovibrionales bacterium]